MSSIKRCPHYKGRFTFKKTYLEKGKEFLMHAGVSLFQGYFKRSPFYIFRTTAESEVSRI